MCSDSRSPTATDSDAAIKPDCSTRYLLHTFHTLTIQLAVQRSSFGSVLLLCEQPNYPRRPRHGTINPIDDGNAISPLVVHTRIDVSGPDCPNAILVNNTNQEMCWGIIAWRANLLGTKEDIVPRVRPLPAPLNYVSCH